MEVAETIKQVRTAVRNARDAGKTIGLVPTMGALHAGHVSLIKAAREKCTYVVVSIFVNPTQFGPGEDFEKYPRPIENDLDICRREGVDLVFNPTPEEIYGAESLTWVTVEKLTEPLCGRFRPGHFRGVTTVCAKLFNIVLPDYAFFGQKDAQQAVVIRKMVADLNFPLEIIVCPTVREPDGLAISSRNQYLSEQQRKDATYIFKSLQCCRELIDRGTSDTAAIIKQMKEIIDTPGSLEIEYISIVDPETLEELPSVSGKVLVAVAARIGPARLIDNILIDPVAEQSAT